MRIEEVLKQLRRQMTIILVTNLTQQARRLADRAQQGQPEFFMSLVAVGRGRVALSAGGVLCADRDGQVIGAVGVSGDDVSDVDEACATAAIDACGYSTIP